MATRRGKARTGSILERTVERTDKKTGKKKKRKEVFARVTFLDSAGRRKDKLRRAESRTHARELIQEMLREVDEYGEDALDNKDKTFAELADHYETHYLTEAEYVDGKKVAGLRSLATPKGFLQTLRAHFGRRQLLAITYGEIRAFRTARLKTPTRSDIARHERELRQNQHAELRCTRSVASVNRELALLRRMLNVALQEGWIRRNPMHAGDSLICIAAEHKRERILTFEEERRLLDACTGRREHLRLIIIAALETGMRRGELLKLKWSDIDFERRIILVRAFNTKTMRAREVGISSRLCVELEQAWQASQKGTDALVFGISDNVKRSFDGARLAAGLPDVRFHDLRHTYATRLISWHMPSLEVGRLLGHTQANTTYRYVNANEETARRAADTLDALRAANVAPESHTTEMIN
ncbi:MAG TPA: site-specific integrase [Pyrinomonadaceae bacterium]|nr:site-specific integrase [Pyrinomonadaceae bacterium]